MSHLVKTVIGRTLITLFVAYIILNTTKTIQKNYQINTEISRLNQEIVELKLDLKHLENKTVYLNSDAYRELEVKRRLGLKKQGEKVILVAQNHDQNVERAEISTQSDIENISLTEENFFQKASKNALTWFEWVKQTP